MVIRHIEQVTGTLNQFTSIMSNFAILFVKHDFLQYTQADTLKREERTFLLQLASTSSEWLYFYASVSFSALSFFPLFIAASCCGADGQKCWLRGCCYHGAHPSAQATALVPAQRFAVPVSAYISQGQTSQKPPWLRYEEIYCYSFSGRIRLGYYSQTSEITCNVCGCSLF